MLRVGLCGECGHVGCGAMRGVGPCEVWCHVVCGVMWVSNKV